MSDLLKKIWVIHSFTHFWWETWAICSHCSFIFGERLEWFAHIAHFWWATCSFLKNLQKIVPKKYDSKQILLSELLVFCKQKCESLKKTSDSLICSFIMSNLRKLLMVALLTWVTWAIRSQSLICPERSEQIAHSHSFDLSELIERANERWANKRIPNPALNPTLVIQL